MKTDEQLYYLVKKYLEDELNCLWDELTPEERNIVFRGKHSIINRFLEENF